MRPRSSRSPVAKGGLQKRGVSAGCEHSPLIFPRKAGSAGFFWKFLLPACPKAGSGLSTHEDSDIRCGCFQTESPPSIPAHKIQPPGFPQMPTLNWIGKDAVINHHLEVPFRLLKDVPDLGCGDPGSGNLIMEGDNLASTRRTTRATKDGPTTTTSTALFTRVGSEKSLARRGRPSTGTIVGFA